MILSYFYFLMFIALLWVWMAQWLAHSFPKQGILSSKLSQDGLIISHDVQLLGSSGLLPVRTLGSSNPNGFLVSSAEKFKGILDAVHSHLI